MSGQWVVEESMYILNGGQSQSVSLSAASAQSTAITGARTLVICSTVDCWLRQGANPTALSNGTDQFLPAKTMVRLGGFTSGNKVAAIAGGAGTLYITPEH